MSFGRLLLISRFPPGRFSRLLRGGATLVLELAASFEGRLVY